MAAISAVFTINRVAVMLGEGEDWLHEFSIGMFPEGGCLHVYRVAADGVTAFTPYGIECPQQIIQDERQVANAPQSEKPTE